MMPCRDTRNPVSICIVLRAFTGQDFFAYILMRVRGVSPAEAIAALTDMRPVTAEQVGDDRIVLAEEVFQAQFAESPQD